MAEGKKMKHDLMYGVDQQNIKMCVSIGFDSFEKVGAAFFVFLHDDYERFVPCEVGLQSFIQLRGGENCYMGLWC